MLRRYPLLFFFLLSYIISWSIWSPLLLAKQGIITDRPPQYLHLLGSLGPALAALIMRRMLIKLLYRRVSVPNAAFPQDCPHRTCGLDCASPLHVSLDRRD